MQLEKDYEQYGKLYTQYISDCLLKKDNVTFFVNLITKDQDEDLDLFKDLNESLLLNDDIPYETKSVIKTITHRNYDIVYTDTPTLIKELEEFVNFVNKDTTFYIFGTYKIPNITNEFHNLIKRYDNNTISIKHS